MAVLQTLCIIEHDGRILLGRKKVRLGAGKWNGFGGKVEPGDTPQAATIREVREESGLEVTDLEQFGLLNFISPARAPIEAHLFRTSTFSGTPVETDEMAPRWFHRSEIPFTEMWSSDLYWWPLYFHHKRFTGTFEFDEHDRVIHRELTIVDSLDI